MARSTRHPKASQRPHDKPPGRRPGAPPDWPVVALAALGALLTGYLTIVALGSGTPAFCTVGSGCDLVQQSQWSRFLGVPVALFGFGLYALLALVAAAPQKPAKRWRRLWSLALVGLAVSVYLTLLGVFSLGTVCTWCLISLLLIVAIFVLLNLRRTEAGAGFAWRGWLANHAIVLVALLGVLYAQQSGLLTPPENPRLAALASHLSDRGAKFYGAEWCPNCREQKRLFGRSAERLPYVECSPNGPKGAVSFTCVSAGVTAYPTWVIRGRSYTEVLQPEDLARRSGFDWAGFRDEARTD